MPEKTPLTPDEALAKLEQFCAYRERAPFEVRDKLRELGMTGETAEQLFGLLRDEGFFNEERFARAFAGGKFRVNQWGRVRIRMELHKRRIAPHLIETALDEEIDAVHYETVLASLLAQKKAQLEKKRDPQARIKAAAALARAGFESELIFRLLEP
jgi:regulatory protein